MKKNIARLLFCCLLLSPALAAEPKFGINFDLRAPGYSYNSAIYQADAGNYVAGLGMGLKVPLGQDLSALYEAQFNTTGNYTLQSGATKAIVKAHPISVSLQKNFSWWYFGAGVNYTFFDATVGGIKQAETGGLGGQLFTGWQDVLVKNLDLTLKYTLMSAVSQSLGSLSLGCSYWLEFPAFYQLPNKA